MKLWEKQKNFSHLQVLFGIFTFYVFCLYDNFSGVLYPVFLAGMLMLYQGLMKQAGRSIKKTPGSICWPSCFWEYPPS